MCDRRRDAGLAAKARSRFEKAINRSPRNSKVLALSHLHLGRALDLLNDRTRAVQQYQKVLQYESFDDSHERAKDYLEEPYKG